MKTSKKLFATIISSVMILSMAQPTIAATVNYGAELTDMPTKSYVQTFTDVPKSYWAFSYIGEMVDRGVLNGYPDGKFYPDNNVSRAEFAKIMTVAAGLSVDDSYDGDYVDVLNDPDNSWAAPYIQVAKYYLSGYVSNGLKYYRPENNALREDIAVALVKLKGYSTTGYDLSMIKTMFSDWQSISTSAQPYVATAVEKGLISGYDDGTFKGQQGITRAEAATLLWRAYQYGDDNKVYEPEVIEPPVTTPTQPVETEKPIVKEDVKKEDTKPVYKNDDDNDDELDDDDYDYEEDNNAIDEEQEPESEKDYGWELTTVKSGIDGILWGQTVPNGFSYVESIEDNKIYEVNDSGKVTVIFDASKMKYLGNDEDTKSKYFKSHSQILSYGYNIYDNCYYAAIIQKPEGAGSAYSLRYYLYNITNDEIVYIINNDTIAGAYPYDGDFGITDDELYALRRHGTSISPYLHFYKNGDYRLTWRNNDWIISSYGTLISHDDWDGTSYYIYNNDFYPCPDSRSYIIGLNSYYYAKSNYEIWSYNYNEEDNFLLSIDDIDNVEERRFNITDIVSNGAITDDESKIYFYDHGYGTIRKIERKK